MRKQLWHFKICDEIIKNVVGMFFILMAINDKELALSNRPRVNDFCFKNHNIPLIVTRLVVLFAKRINQNIFFYYNEQESV